MVLYLFEQVEHVSDNYHDNGGLVIVANDLEHANDLISGDEYIKPSPEEWKKAIVYELAGTHEPKVFVFPDAGCC